MPHRRCRRRDSCFPATQGILRIRGTGATPRYQGLPRPVVIRKPASLSLEGSHSVLLGELSEAVCAGMFSFRADKSRQQLACAPSDVALGRRQLKSCTRQAHSIVLFNAGMLWVQVAKPKPTEPLWDEESYTYAPKNNSEPPVHGVLPQSQAVSVHVSSAFCF